MERYKKWVGIIVLMLTALVLQACGNNGMEYVEQCIEEGKYQDVHIIVNEFDLEETGKLGDLIADVNNYNEVKSLLQGQAGENDLEEAKRLMQGFNGSYKKYKTFKKDVEGLEERIAELESHRSEINEVIQKIQDCYNDMDYETMDELIAGYEANEVLVSDTSREQGEKIESIMLQYGALHGEEWEESETGQQREFDDSLIGGTKEGQQIGTEQNPSEDSIDTEMDIVD